MSLRVLNRMGARELTREELDQIRVGSCLITACGVVPHIRADDTRCEGV